MVDYLRILRPQQWIKNVFLFAGLIFSRHFFYTDSVVTSVYAFLIFCILSSGIYILNDILDYAEDRVHPRKSRRPIAAGRVNRTTALAVAVVFIVLSLVLAHSINNAFLYTCMIYAGITLSYSLLLKRIIILDVLVVASGYVLRAIAGAVAIKVEISSWLLLCTLLLALFIAVTKRRTEIIILGEKAVQHRKTLHAYSLELLNQMSAIVTSACIVAYCLYTLAPETVSKFHTRDLIYTVPFVLYGLFRYLYRTSVPKETDSPERLIVTDVPLIICLLLWITVCLVILVSASSASP